MNGTELPMPLELPALTTRESSLLFEASVEDKKTALPLPEPLAASSFPSTPSFASTASVSSSLSTAVSSLPSLPPLITVNSTASPSDSVMTDPPSSRQNANACSSQVKVKNEEESMDDDDEEYCHKCDRSENQTSMAICDRCDHCFHIYCLNPPLESVPKDEWFCTDCLQRHDRLVNRIKRANQQTEKPLESIADECHVDPETFVRWYNFTPLLDSDIGSSEICEFVESWLEKAEEQHQQQSAAESSGGGAPPEASKDSPYHQYGCCRHDEILARTRYVVARDGIPKDVVCQQSGLDQDTLSALLRGKELADPVNAYVGLASWLFENDRKFSAHVFNRVNSVRAVTSAKVAHAVGISPSMFQNWLQTTLDLEARERIDNILITKFPNLTKGREGVYVKSPTIPTGPNVGLSHGALGMSGLRKRSKRNLSPRAPRSSKRRRAAAAAAATATAAAAPSGPPKPSLGSALQNVAGSNGIYSGSDTGGDPPVQQPRRMRTRSDPDPDLSSMPSPVVDAHSETEFNSPFQIRTRSRQRIINQRKIQQQEKQELIDEQMQSAFTPVRRMTPTNSPAELGPNGPSSESILMSQAKINFENIITLIEGKRYAEAKEVAITAALYLQSRCCVVD